MLLRIFLLISIYLSAAPTFTEMQEQEHRTFDPGQILSLMYRVHDHFLEDQWKQNDRNWIRATYYTGLMAFYRVTKDTNLYGQLNNWGQKHAWRTGTEWIYPANRMTCSQTWIQLYEINPQPYMIENTRSFMDKRIRRDEAAFDAGWDYVDALYVGVPAYMMMSRLTGDNSYAAYGNRIFKEVYQRLYNRDAGLFYRDMKAQKTTSENGRPEFWSRGNGWAFASIPRILNYLPEQDTNIEFYAGLLQTMAESLAACQGYDGFWRTSLLDPETYPDPESSGTAFFTYGLAWGIRNELLDREAYLPVVAKAWNALYHVVDESGRVGCGQDVARAPGHVDKKSTREFVSGAFLLAASEVYQLAEAGMFSDYFLLKKE